MQMFEKGKKNVNDFQWYTKAWVRCEDDVLLSLSKNTSKLGERACITLKNKASIRVIQTGYAIAGVDGDRLYFAESDRTNGYKLVGDENRATFQISNPKFIEWVRERKGGYTLHQDANSGLYFIETRRLV